MSSTTAPIRQASHLRVSVRVNVNVPVIVPLSSVCQRPTPDGIPIMCG